MPNMFLSTASLIYEEVPGAGAPMLNCLAFFRSSKVLMPVAPQA